MANLNYVILILMVATFSRQHYCPLSFHCWYIQQHLIMLQLFFPCLSPPMVKHLVTVQLIYLPCLDLDIYMLTSYSR